MRRIWLFLVSALTVLAFVITPTSAGAAVTTDGLWETEVPPCIAIAGDACGIADPDSYELGVKFQTSQPIYVVGVRFYRFDAGTWDGSLWNVSGQVRLANANDSTSGTGWQDAMFADPVPMGTGDTFIASYSAPAGGYAYEHNYFATTGKTVGPVTALQSGVVGPNGVFNFDPDVYPQGSYLDSNYWVTPLWVVPYGFEGFHSPVDNEALNVAKAGQSIPLKFQVTDGESGAPVTDLTTPPLTVSSKGAACGSSDLPTDAIETYAGGSGLQYLGDGYYQFNWKTLKSYKGHCRTMTLSLGDGNEYTAVFQFT